MDIGALSMIMNQSKVQESAGISLIKIAMDNNNENAVQMTKMMTDVAADPNLGQYLDVKA